MATDPEGVVEFKAGGKKRKLYFGIRAEKAVEKHFDLPFFKAIQKAMPSLTPEDMADKAKVAEESSKIRFTDIAKLFEFALLKFEPEIEETAVENIIDELGLSRTTELLGQSLVAALNLGDEGDAPENPPPASR